MREVPLDVAFAVAGENAKLALGGGVTLLLEALEGFLGPAWCGVLGVLVDEDSGPRGQRVEQVPGAPRQLGCAPTLELLGGKGDEVEAGFVRCSRSGGGSARWLPHDHQLPSFVVGGLESDQAGWLAVDWVNGVGLEDERLEFAPLREGAVGKSADRFGGGVLPPAPK